MVENVKNAQDSYIKCYMAKLPEVQKGESHVIKKGDNLWNIARSQLGKKSKRSEINDYMLTIAKLNGLDTVQKMNNLKVNSTIYLPKNSNNVDTPNKLQSKSLSQDKYAYQNKVQKTPIFKTQAEKCFNDRLNTFLTNKVHVRKAFFMDEIGANMYHVSYNYTDKSGFTHFDKPIMSVTVSKQNNKIEDIAFEDDKNIYRYGYDYKIEKDNIIKSNNVLETTQYGKITPQQRELLEKTLLKYINESK